MSDGSTPRPWRVDVVDAGFDWEILGPSDRFCADVVGTINSGHNARRIVAAVNATSDLPIEALEADVVRKLVEALEAIQHSMAQAKIAGNDWRRELDLTANIAGAALTLAKGEAA